MAASGYKWVKVHDYVGNGIQYPIKSGVVVASTDLVALDSNGQVVLADNTTPVEAIGAAVFVDDLGTAAARTGVAGLTVKCAIARKGIINGATSLTIGGRSYVGAAGGYTATATTTNAQIRQIAGYVTAADTIEFRIEPSLTYQTAGNSVATF